eukprot:GEMP01033172.1.p1 GENE.GEMP01033172.1~~GEMP01033172.1.p1  ORF type:complete len:405 (+),score=53.24 GEMP01033172.1:41-1255(+)
MGAIISAPLGCLASCGGSCAGMCCAKLVGQGTVDNEKGSKQMFFGLQAYGVALLLLLRSTGKDWFYWLPVGLSQCSKQSDADDCWEQQMTYRVCFSVSLLFAILLFISGIGMQKSALMHYWIGKFVAIPFLVFLTLFMPNSMFDDVDSLAVISSILFILAQMILLLDFGHCWNDNWLRQSLEDQRRDLSSTGLRWVIGILSFSIGFLVFAVIVASMCHTTFVSTPSKVVIWVNFSIGAFLVIFSTTSLIPNGSLLPSALVFAYMTFVAWDACLSIPADPYNEVQVDPTANRVFGFIFLSLALGSFVRDPKIFNFEDDDDALISNDAETGGDGGGEDGDGTAVSKKSTCIFFLIHMFGALYVITLLCDRRSPTTFWALAVADWLMLALFAWSLIAPQVLDREFGY